MSKKLYENIGEYEEDKLIAGNEVPILIDSVEIVQGVKLKRGTVIAIKTDDKTANIVNSTLSDGLQNPYAILTDDVDTTELAPGETEKVSVYISGYFNGKYLIVSDTDEVEDFKLELRKLGIFIN